MQNREQNTAVRTKSGGEKPRSYIAIDLKSFYASVECVERKLDPLTTNLVVADESRTSKTICLAVSPSLKACGIPGRPRLFEVIQRAEEVNRQRRRAIGGAEFRGTSAQEPELKRDPFLRLEYITAVPRMRLYMEYSSRIYDIYLKYVSKDDIHIYSVDEVFIDVTDYLETYGLTPRELAVRMIRDVLKTTGITATAGIGPNLYLCKVAMDIVAKHIPADADGVRIAQLDEASYRRFLWAHRPLTDFWRVGRGYAKRLAEVGIYTMGDIAKCSAGKAGEFYNEDLLYKLFGKNAELLIDHAWGWEPCRISDIKAYRPLDRSISQGQVLQEPYPSDRARLIVREMTDMLALDLAAKELTCSQVVLTVVYDVENLSRPEIMQEYRGEIETDYYGRPAPKKAFGSVNLGEETASPGKILEAASALYDRIVNPLLLVRRIYVVANHIKPAGEAAKDAAGAEAWEQLELFTDYEAKEAARQKEAAGLEREKKIQQAVLEIKKKYGKNAILKGMNLEEGATAIERNRQVGGHRG